MAMVTMPMMAVSMVMMPVMMVVPPAMMMVVMAGWCVVCRLSVIHGCRAYVVHRGRVVIDAAREIAITEHHTATHTRVGGGDLGAKQAANKQRCTNNLLHDFLHVGVTPIQGKTLSRVFG